jgi:ATP-dependent Zn protease
MVKNLNQLKFLTMENNNEPIEQTTEEQEFDNHVPELEPIEEKPTEEIPIEQTTEEQKFDNHVPELDEKPIKEQEFEIYVHEEKPTEEKTEKRIKENPEPILTAKPKSKNSDFENIIWLIVILIVIVLIYYITTYFTNGKKNYTTQPGHDYGNGSEYTTH